MLKFYKKSGVAIAGIFLSANAFSQCTAPLNQTVTPANTNVICSGNATINVANTETGVNYYLRNNLDNSIVAGPVAGTGSAINLTSNNVISSSTFNVNAVAPTTALDFETDLDNYVSVGTSMNSVFTGTNQITVEAWINLESYSFLPTIVGNYNSGMQFLLRIDNQRPSFWVSNGSFQNILGTTVIPLNTWVHLAGTWDGTTMKVYYNGVLEGSTPVSGTFPSAPNEVRIGASRTDESFDGKIDNLRIWNVAKTGTEINNNRSTCLTGAQPNLVALYNFDVVSPTTLSDLSGNGYNGTLVLNPVWASGTDICSTCSLQMAALPTITVDPIAQQAITPVNTNVICSGNATINVANTETGVNYFLRNDFDNTIIAGPVAGTGSAVTLNTGNISSTTTFNIFAEKPSTALDFDGIDDKVVVPATSLLDVGSADFTVEAMVKFTASQSNYAGLVAKGGFTGPFYQLVLYDNKLAAEIHDGSSLVGVGSGLIGSTILNDGNWHHVAMVVDRASTNAKLYVDGIQETSVTDPVIGNNLNNPSDMLIGTERGSGIYFSGKMDEVRIWNTARSVSQITTNSSACLTGTETGLVAYYNFENGSGSSLTDIASGDNNGILVNMDPVTAWGSGANNCGCTMEMTTTPTVTVNPIVNQTVSAAQSAFCYGGSTTINVASSETTVDYYLRNDLNDTIVSGPLAGTGSGISFNTGTISTTTTYNVLAERSQPNLALDFDGADDYVSIPSGINIANQSFTIEFWAKRSNSGSYNFIIGQGSGGTNDGLHIGFRDNDAFTFAFYGNDIDVFNSATTDGNYHHWSCVYTSGAIGVDRFVYLDGNLVGSDDASGDYTGSGELKIGDLTFSNNSFNGSIDEVRIWDAALTQTAIQTGMTNCLTGTESNLVAYYKMDNVSSNTLTDITGNGHDGTLINMDPSTDWVNGTPMLHCTYCESEMTPTATITINTSTASTMTAAACDNYTLNSQTYTATGSYMQILTNAAGCDSILTIGLTITNSSSSSITVTECDNYTAPDGAVYTASGTETAIILNAAGCDSTITINLTINTVDASISQSGNILTANASGATYGWMNCSTNTIISGETGQSFTAITGGDYAAIVTENTCVDTSACINITVTGFSSISGLDSQISVYPNPNNGTFVIRSNTEGTYTLVNALGQVIQTIKLTSADNYSVEINNIDNGVYFILGSNNNLVTRQKIAVTK